MGYVRTAGMSTAARRRRRRTALVLTVLLLILAVVLFIAITQFNDSDRDPSGDGGDQTAGPTEEVTQEPPDLDPGEITINVYNATQRAGLAGGTAEAMEGLGYNVAAFDNDPEGATVQTVDLRHGPEGLEAATYLQIEVFPDAQLVEDDREDATVDVVLGEDFGSVGGGDE